jgi:hypothetical protein
MGKSPTRAGSSGLTPPRRRRTSKEAPDGVQGTHAADSTDDEADATEESAHAPAHGSDVLGEMTAPVQAAHVAAEVAHEPGAETTDLAHEAQTAEEAADATHEDQAETTDRARTGVSAEESRAGAKRPRFHIYVIDTGWNSAARKVLEENLALLHDLTHDDPVYVLDRDMSVEFMRRHPSLIGRDPIICAHDLWEISRSGTSCVHGVRVHLGLLRDEDKVLQALQMFARFLSTQRMSANLEDVMRRRLRLEGLAGAFELAMGGTPQDQLVV